MGYRELLEAVEDEVSRQIHRIEAETQEECQRLIADTRREVTARHQEALAREHQRLAEEAQRTLARARVEQARALLSEQRRVLDSLRQKAERHLSAVDDVTLLLRLVDELAPELEEGPFELHVNPRHQEAFARELVRHHPDLAGRATVNATDSVIGGVIAVLDDGRFLLDNSLPSRLKKTWQKLEGDISADLFGTTDGSRM